MNELKDIFVIPLSKNRYIVYAPKTKFIFLTDRKSLPNLSSYFKKLGKKQSKNLKNKVKASTITSKQKFDNYGMTLCITTDCNLRCIYCYASGGDRKKYMDFKIAKAAIDFGLSKIKKGGRYNLSFHGGGEPFVAFDIMKKCTEYAKEKCKKRGIRLSLSSATNGVLSNEQLDWIIKNKMHLNISFDGTPDIQDSQRPLAGGKPSHLFVENTVKKLNRSKINYGVRATITKLGVKKMDEIVDYFHKLGVKSMHFEPVFECGRCLKTKTSSPDPMIFVKNYIKAFELAEKYGMSLYYSAGTIRKFTNTFCGAAGENFFVTSDGYITSCLEVMHKDDPASKVFFYGRFDEKKGRFVIDKKRLNLLKSRTVDKIKNCQSCFSKWHCAGDCLVKSWRENGTLFKVNEKRCVINRELVKYVLLRYINGKPIKMKDFDLAREIEIE